MIYTSKLFIFNSDEMIQFQMYQVLHVSNWQYMQIWEKVLKGIQISKFHFILLTFIMKITFVLIAILAFVLGGVSSCFSDLFQFNRTSLPIRKLVSGYQLLISKTFFHYICFWFPLGCPSGWIDGGQLGCYLAAKEASKINHTSAQNYCKSLDKRAHLAEIRTQEIQTFLEGLENLQSNHWWLGGNDQAKV